MILNISWQPETVETWSIDIFMWPFKLCHAMYCVSTMSGLLLHQAVYKHESSKPTSEIGNVECHSGVAIYP